MDDENFLGGMEKCKWGSRGSSPWDASPSGGGRGLHSYSLVKNLLPTKKKSDEFLHPDRIKNFAFFSVLLLSTARVRKTITCIEADAALIQAQDADKDGRNPRFFLEGTTSKE